MTMCTGVVPGGASTWKASTPQSTLWWEWWQWLCLSQPTRRSNNCCIRRWLTVARRRGRAFRRSRTPTPSSLLLTNLLTNPFLGRLLTFRMTPRRYPIQFIPTHLPGERLFDLILLIFIVCWYNITLILLTYYYSKSSVHFQQIKMVEWKIKNTNVLHGCPCITGHVMQKLWKLLELTLPAVE